MSDYTTPAVSDESVNNLADAINSFYTEISGDVGNINEMLAEVVTKYYTVNHDPQIELPFEAEYEYICEKVNKSLSSSYKTVNNFTHIFISGFLPNGKTIRYNALEKDEKGYTVSKYAGLYINGTQTYTDYTCRAEEGGWERINVLIVGAPKMSPYAARLDIDYADIPLKDFKMIVFDDLEEPVSPNINSFLAEDIDTLKCIGDLRWTYTGLCTIRRLEITKDITVTGTMDCPCLQALILPNATEIPNISPSAWYSMTELDISNYNGDVSNVYFPNLTEDLTLKCRSISGLKVNRPITIDVGNRCVAIYNNACQNSKIRTLIGGSSLSEISQHTFNGCTNLIEVDISNSLPVKLVGYATFENCTALRTVKVNAIVTMASDSFRNCRVLQNLVFAPKGTACNLYFNASPVLTEESCLNIINAIADNAKITVSLHSTVKTLMQNSWYCKLENDKYVTCAAEDEGAITQAEAIVLRGGTLA